MRIRLTLMVLLLAFTSAHYCHAQKIKRIETKLFNSGEEATTEDYAFINYGQDGQVVDFKLPQWGGSRRDSLWLQTDLPLYLFAEDLGLARYPLMMGSTWLTGFKNDVVARCERNGDCSINLTMNLDLLQRIELTSSEIIEEISDKFDYNVDKAPSSTIERYQISYYDDQQVKQIKFESIENNQLIAARLYQFVYKADRLSQAMIADIQTDQRTNYTFGYEDAMLSQIASSSWNSKKQKWNRPSSLRLSYDSDTKRLTEVQKTDEKGRASYTQQFIYSEY